VPLPLSCSGAAAGGRLNSNQGRTPSAPILPVLPVVCNILSWLVVPQEGFQPNILFQTHTFANTVLFAGPNPSSELRPPQGQLRWQVESPDMTPRMMYVASAAAMHFDPSHAPSAATVALAREQWPNDCRGPPGRFGPGKGGPLRKTLPLRRAENGNTQQPHWIMDQIYLLLTAFHVVIKPFALASVPQKRIIRTITSMFRFVNTYTKDTLGLFQEVALGYFSRSVKGDDPRIFPMPALQWVTWKLLSAACKGNPGATKIPRNFHWDKFCVSPDDEAFIVGETLQGFLVGVAHSRVLGGLAQP
jgi:hypothetical protein